METRHINPRQLSRRWGVQPKTLQNWRSCSAGPAYIKIGGRVLYRLEDIEQYEKDHYHRVSMTQRSQQIQGLGE